MKEFCFATKLTADEFQGEQVAPVLFAGYDCCIVRLGFEAAVDNSWPYWRNFIAADGVLVDHIPKFTRKAQQWRVRILLVPPHPLAMLSQAPSHVLTRPGSSL